jgi:hypothetical protein
MSDRAQNNYKFVELQTIPGTSPLVDSTKLSSIHYTDSQRIRFYRNAPEKLGGWTVFNTEGVNTIQGCTRNVYSQRINEDVFTLFGTHTSLYALIGTTLTNITPLDTTLIAIPDSIDTNVTSLANDPIDTVLGSMTVTVNNPAHAIHPIEPNDRVELTGVVGPVNGIPAVELNTTHIVRSTTVNTYTILVPTAATSTGSGGGAAIEERTAVLTVNRTAHGLSNGARISISSATGFAGIPAGDINQEHIIRDALTDSFDITVNTIANASLTGQGGGATEMQDPIEEGMCDASFGMGYGLGLYGAGLYGTSKTGSEVGLPRIWSFDRFGSIVVLTPGNQTGLYEWNGDINVAPTLVANAPAAINYVFVSDNIVVTLGADGVENRIQWSDQGDRTDWTPTAQNFAGQDDIEGADRFLSQVNVRGVNLLWTDNELYTFRFIGKPFIWETKRVNKTEGILGQNARIGINGVAYWVSNNDFFAYSGGVIRSIPGNSPDGQNYIRRFIFNDLNQTQKVKSFAWFNEKFSEIWFHFPRSTSDEPNVVARYSINENIWTIDRDFDRTAAEYPVNQDIFPKLVDTNNIIYRHEDGVNDADQPMSWYLDTNYLQLGSNEMEVGGVVPDSIQTGDITLSVTTSPYPQSTKITTQSSLTITPTTEKVDFLNTGRNRQYRIENSDLDTNWRMGKWFEKIQIGAPR